MASPLPSGDPPLTIAVQAGHLRRRYDVECAHRDARRLVWLARLTPTEYSDSYDVLVDHQVGEDPLVYVPRPKLAIASGQDRLPHVYRLNTLCLFRGNHEWHPSIPIAETLVPWSCEWLHYYELWLVDGDWHGEGQHPSASSPSRRARRAQDRNDAAKLKRIRSALIHAYGRDANLSELLHTVHL